MCWDCSMQLGWNSGNRATISLSCYILQGKIGVPSQPIQASNDYSCLTLVSSHFLRRGGTISQAEVSMLNDRVSLPDRIVHVCSRKS